MFLRRARGVLLGGHLVDGHQEGFRDIREGVVRRLAVELLINLLELLLLRWVEAHQVLDGNLGGGLGCRRGRGRGWRHRHDHAWDRKQRGEEAAAHLVGVNLECRCRTADGEVEVVGECGVHFVGWKKMWTPQTQSSLPTKNPFLTYTPEVSVSKSTH